MPNRVVREIRVLGLDTGTRPRAAAVSPVKHHNRGGFCSGALVDKLDNTLREWRPEMAEEVRARISEVIEIADSAAADRARGAPGHSEETPSPTTRRQRQQNLPPPMRGRSKAAAAHGPDREQVRQNRPRADSRMAEAVAAAPCQTVLMSIFIVRLGTPRVPGEGLRIGTVRRPPRGVPKEDFARLDYYDVWFPNLSPTAELVHEAQQARDDRGWNAFKRKFKHEMSAPDRSRELDLLAALSHHTNLAVGCYCPDENRCHRSVLRELLAERGADIRT